MRRSQDPELEEWVKLLLDQALIAEGQMVSDPLAFSQRVSKLMVKASSQQ